MPLTTSMFINCRYDKDAKWRAAWNALANDVERRRKRYPLQIQQEYIEHRAVLANRRIATLMEMYDIYLKINR